MKYLGTWQNTGMKHQVIYQFTSNYPEPKLGQAEGVVIIYSYDYERTYIVNDIEGGASLTFNGFTMYLWQTEEMNESCLDAKGVCYYVAELVDEVYRNGKAQFYMLNDNELIINFLKSIGIEVSEEYADYDTYEPVRDLKLA